MSSGFFAGRKFFHRLLWNSENSDFDDILVKIYGVKIFTKFSLSTFYRNNCYKKEVMKIDGRSLIGSDRDQNELMPRSRVSRDVNTTRLCMEPIA